MIEQLVTALRNSGLDPSAEDLADLLWLAEQMGIPTYQQAAAFVSHNEAGPRTEPPQADTKRDSASEKTKQPQQSEQAGTNKQGGADLQARSEGNNEGAAASGLPFRSPSGVALPGALELARSLRHLKRRIPSRYQFLLDEEATIRRIADTDEWSPVQRRAQTRWLDVILVIDQSSSMVVWEQTIHEFQQLLERQGAFRTVQRWYIATDWSTTEPGLYAQPSSMLADSIPRRHPSELLDPRGERLLLVMSDCVSQGWYDGTVATMLDIWTETGLVALVQMLPQHLWPRTALRIGTQVYVRSRQPGTANAKLEKKYRLSQQPKKSVADGVVLPVITLEKERILPWAKLIVGANPQWTPGITLPLHVVYKADDELLDQLPLTAEERFQHFFATASSIAQELAGYLSMVPLSLGVMRLVQEAMFKKESRQIHLGEVLLGGLIQQRYDLMYTKSDDIRYEFFPGVREQLQDTVLASDKVRVLEEVSNFVNAHTGQRIGFRALIHDPSLVDTIEWQGETEKFATIAIDVLERLGGRYAQLAATLRDVRTTQTKIVDYPKMSNSQSYPGIYGGGRFTFQNFDLLIEPDRATPASYIVHVVNSPAGESRTLVQLPFDVNQISAFYQAVHGTAALQTAMIRQWGEQLFAALFVGEIKSALQRSLDLMLAVGRGLRLRLQLGDDLLLWILPWEYLYEPTYQRFLAQSAQTPIVRTIALPRKISPLPLNSPLKILVVLVNPLHQAERKQAEWAHIRATLQEAISGGTLQLKLLSASNLSGLQRHLRRHAYHVVHLIGSEGFHTAADGAALSLLFQQQAALRLVLLTGEPLGDQSASLPLHRLTQHLLQRGIVSVVAAQFAQQPTALAFVGEFYSAMVDGYPLDAAMGEARAAVALLQDETWGMPMLGMLTTDGSFFQEAERVAQPDRSQSTVKPNSPERGADAAAPLNNSGAINSGGGTVIIGNVYTDNFTGSDVVSHEPKKTEHAVPPDSVSKLPRYDSTTLSGQPLPWPPLWDKARPADSREIAEWVSMAHLMLNPFGPDQAEWDPELARYRVYPAVFDRCLRGTRSAVVYGGVGSGKTACSLLLADLCQSHAFAASAFPVVCKIDSDITARSTSDAVQNFVIDQLARALVAFCALNPVTFLRLERDQKLAVVACLRQVFGSGEKIKTQFDIAGLGEGEPEQWLLEEVQELAVQVEPSGFQRRDWVNIISKARPAGFARTFFICDMADEALSTVAADAAFLQALIRYIVAPELRAVHLKALLPDQLRNQLRVPGHVITDTLRWTVDELVQVLQVRVIDEQGFPLHFEQLFDPEARFANPAYRLAEAANGSPRQLINLGNQLLAAHVQRRRGQIELTNEELALVLDERSESNNGLSLL